MKLVCITTVRFHYAVHIMRSRKTANKNVKWPVIETCILTFVWVNYLKWRNSNHVLLLRRPLSRYNCSMNFSHVLYNSKLHIPNFLWTVNLLLLKKKNPKTVIFSPQCKWCLLMSAAHDQSSPFWYRSSPYLNWTVRASTWETRPVQPSWQPLHTRYLLSLSTVVQLAKWVQSHFIHQSFLTIFCACCLPRNEKLIFYFLNLVNLFQKCVLKHTFL